jgi:hypothetical protein
MKTCPHCKVMVRAGLPAQTVEHIMADVYRLYQWENCPNCCKPLERPIATRVLKNGKSEKRRKHVHG